MKKVLMILMIQFFCIPRCGAENVDLNEVKRLLGEVTMINKDYEESQKYLREVIESDPDDMDARELLADQLGWQGKYTESIALYDSLPALSSDKGRIYLKKARVLGWTHDYKSALNAYQLSYQQCGDENVLLEKNAKQAYWNWRIFTALKDYEKLIKNVPDDAEIEFDLAQLYAANRQWEKAIVLTEDILNRYPEHFRAAESLQKSQLFLSSYSLTSGYMFFEADSPARDNDIRKHMFFNLLSLPLGSRSVLEFRENMLQRSFSDFQNISENVSGVRFSLHDLPYGFVELYYDYINYDHGVRSADEFGILLNKRFSDMLDVRLMYDRKRMDNNSAVLLGKYYYDSYRLRCELDLSRRLKAGYDASCYCLSDSNHAVLAGADLKYQFTFEPAAFSLKYRYGYTDYHKSELLYFSPEHFFNHTLSFDLRRYLNKEELFFGADDIYYELGYDIGIDSDDVLGQAFRAGFVCDVNKRLQVKLEAETGRSSSGVYDDRMYTCSVRYLF